MKFTKLHLLFSLSFLFFGTILSAEEKGSRSTRQIEINALLGNEKHAEETRKRIAEGRSQKKPQAIKSVDELKSVFKPDEVKELLKKVDFTKEQLILIAWTGSPSDRKPYVESQRNGNFVAFYVGVEIRSQQAHFDD